MSTTPGSPPPTAGPVPGRVPEGLIHADASQARTLPSRAYVDPAWLTAEQNLIFGRGWQWAGSLADLASPGAFVTTEIAGEPVLLARDRAGELRALSNVCRHRAGPVAEGSGHAQAFTCAYHGWRYRLDGSLASAREVGDPVTLNTAEVCLPQFRVATWSGLVFVDVGGSAPPLVDVLGEMVDEVASITESDADGPGIGLGGVQLVAERSDVVACNWKAYVDNYLEGYHIPFVHPRLHRILDTPAYRVEPRRFHSRQFAPLRRRDGEHIYGDADEPVLYYWVFPNLMVNVYPGNIQLNVVTPIDAERTRTWFGWFARPPATDAEQAALDEAVELAGEIQDEDIAICEAVQRGLRSATYDQGWYSTRHEAGVHHFHRLLTEALGPGRPAS